MIIINDDGQVDLSEVSVDELHYLVDMDLNKESFFLNNR